MKLNRIVNMLDKYKELLILICFLIGVCVGSFIQCNKDFPNTRMNDSGELIPLPGYAWDTRVNSKKHAVVWAVDQKHPTISHIYSGELEGSWEPEPGYGWVGYGIDSCQKVLDSAIEVQWCPGVEHPKFSHVRAGVSVENWKPEEGYQFICDDSLEVERVIIVEKVIEKIVEKEVPKTIVKYVEKNKSRR